MRKEHNPTKSDPYMETQRIREKLLHLAMPEELRTLMVYQGAEAHRIQGWSKAFLVSWCRKHWDLKTDSLIQRIVDRVKSGELNQGPINRRVEKPRLNEY